MNIFKFFSKKITINNAIKRITKYEKDFDLLQSVWSENPETLGKYKGKLKSLIRYYENGRWLKDFTLDEQNLLPKNLKRGILSEDGFYNFLEEIIQIKKD